MTTSKAILLVGVIMIVLAAFGVEPIDSASLFQLGVGVSFASFLVP